MNDEIIKIIKEAGKIALDFQSKMIIDNKVDDSIVTNGDIAVSNFLERELSKWYPVLSEENYNINEKSKKVFIIDPIDGTISYSKKEDSWSVMVALVDGVNPIEGFVYQPTLNLMYYTKDGKSYKEENGKVTLMKYNNLIDKEKIIAVISPNEKKSKGYLEKLDDVLSKDKDYIYYYGAGLKMCKVADGEVDVYLSTAKKCSIWDVMAGMAILKNCGAKVYFEKGYCLDRSITLVNSNFCCTRVNIMETKI